MFLSEFIARAAQFGVLALAARHLTAAAFGIYGLAVAMHQLALAVVQNGPELHATRLLAQGGGGGALIPRVIGLKLGLAAAAYALVVLAAFGVYRNAALPAQAMTQELLLPIVAVGSSWALKATGHFTIFAVFRCAQALLFLGFVALLFARGATQLAVPEAEAAATGLVVAASLPLCLRHASMARGTPTERLLGPSLALGLSGLCSDAIWSMPVTIGGLFLDAAALGRVAGVNRILTALNGVYQVLLQVFYPALARRYAEDARSARALAGALLTYAALGSVALTAAGLLFAAPLVRVLLGAGKAETVPVFQLCLGALIPAFVGSVAGYALLAAGRHRPFVQLAVVTLMIAGAGAGIGYALAPVAEMAASQVVAQLFYTAMLLAVAARSRLIDGANISWNLLRPAALRRLLSQR
jgi:O-antigen/teichoic acid export membrane protein